MNEYLAEKSTYSIIVLHNSAIYTVSEWEGSVPLFICTVVAAFRAQLQLSQEPHPSLCKQVGNQWTYTASYLLHYFTTVAINQQPKDYIVIILHRSMNTVTD